MLSRIPLCRVKDASEDSSKFLLVELMGCV
ncbi:hypothetical protein A2U01_0075351 [Trifolium medium]|uniref:Uncharacterized protein n=1 Tax=Trifolium medium TaxID=97028 RepID=A0A392T0T5_9FABA|nr:hypothetical protein [Trifolium medium]